LVAARRSLHERNPLVFWKILSAGLALLAAVRLAWS
jgi:hypothetical protein